MTNAAERPRAELATPGYRCSPIALGIGTHDYHPIERDFRSHFDTQMRGVAPSPHLAVAARFAKAHPRLGCARLPPLDTTYFLQPHRAMPQRELA